MEVVIVCAYLFFLTFILAYSFNQFNLAIIYIKSRRKKKPSEPHLDLNNLPKVTVQLPIYNEKYVVERLINCVAEMDYPKELLEIQVLDDSTDETTEIIAGLCAKLQLDGINIQHIQRPERIDYKAGALDYGLSRCSGEFVAIFDADFLPPSNFLHRSLPYFQNKKVGVVQGRWGHLNEQFSILTQLQAYALNAHFTIEQSSRNFGGHFINFNGTAGIWRKSCIADSGGWHGDTLTEDLDLSYRAQLKKWRFVYLQDLVCLAELPAEMNALKSQQYRWAKGAAECVRKNLFSVLIAKHLSTSTKVHAFFHLSNSFVWVCVLFSGLLLPPFLWAINAQNFNTNYLAFVGIYHFSFFALLFFYLTANVTLSLRKPKDYVKMILLYPGFLALSMGMSLHNGLGVLQGYAGIKSAFVRTAKFNLKGNKGKFRGKAYIKWRPNFTNLLELLCFVYFGYGTWVAIQYEAWIALPFLVMESLGFIAVLGLTWWHSSKS